MGAKHIQMCQTGQKPIRYRPARIHKYTHTRAGRNEKRGGEEKKHSLATQTAE